MGNEVMKLMNNTEFQISFKWASNKSTRQGTLLELLIRTHKYERIKEIFP